MPLLPKGQRLVRDEGGAAGLYLRIGTDTKAWVVQREVRVLGQRKTIRSTIGTFPAMGVRDARAAAPGAVQAIIEAEAGPARSGGATLLEAWEAFRTHLERKGRAAGSIGNYGLDIRLHLAPWRDVKLRKLSEERWRVDELHGSIAGTYAANRAMRTLRAIYNHARTRDDTLPLTNPVTGVTFHQEFRRDSALPFNKFPAWFAQQRAMKNRVRAEFNMFLLLSAMRPDAASRMRWADIRRVDGLFAVHIPLPKGGASKAFLLPLSRPMVACLARPGAPAGCTRRSGRVSSCSSVTRPRSGAAASSPGT